MYGGSVGSGLRARSPPYLVRVRKIDDQFLEGFNIAAVIKMNRWTVKTPVRSKCSFLLDHWELFKRPPFSSAFPTNRWTKNAWINKSLCNELSNSPRSHTFLFAGTAPVVVVTLDAIIFSTFLFVTAVAYFGTNAVIFAFRRQRRATRRIRQLPENTPRAQIWFTFYTAFSPFPT